MKRGLLRPSGVVPPHSSFRPGLTAPIFGHAIKLRPCCPVRMIPDGRLGCPELTMAQRPIWRGHLRLALVSCPVALRAVAVFPQLTVPLNRSGR